MTMVRTSGKTKNGTTIRVLFILFLLASIRRKKKIQNSLDGTKKFESVARASVTHQYQ